MSFRKNDPSPSGPPSKRAKADLDLRQKLGKSSENPKNSGAASRKHSKALALDLSERWYEDFNFEKATDKQIRNLIRGTVNIFTQKINGLKHALGQSSATNITKQVDQNIAKDQIHDLKKELKIKLKEIAATVESKNKYKDWYLELKSKYEILI